MRPPLPTSTPEKEKKKKKYIVMFTKLFLGHNKKDLKRKMRKEKKK